MRRFLCILVAALSIPLFAHAQTITPQGRLTLTTGTPVMTADATAQTTVYYDCYAGIEVPVSGTNLTIGSCQISMGLDAVTPHITSGDVYDIFAVNNSSTLVICAGPAWSSTTSRGSGAGTTQIHQNTTSGLWTNANSLTHCWGGASGTTDYGSVSADDGTYLGSLYATANGQTGMQFAPSAASGGSNNILGLYNAYNRVLYSSLERDSTSSWTYTTASWRAANNSNSNRVSWLDGLSQSTGFATECGTLQPASGVTGYIGLSFNAVTTPVVNSGQSYTSPIAVCTSGAGIGLGLNFVQEMEYGGGGSGTKYYAGGNSQETYFAVQD